MATVTLGAHNIEEVVASNDIVLVDFWASWCGPCRMFGPIFERASEQHPDLTFAKVNTEEEQELAARFGIMSIPTLMVFRDQILVFSQPGALPAPVLEELIGKVEALDMEEVRQHVMASQKEATG
jgi:thioredoxin 1